MLIQFGIVDKQFILEIDLVKLTLEIPKKDGWYWLEHPVHGLIITNVIVYSNNVHIMDNGFYGWNKFLYENCRWSDSPIKSPIEE